MVMQDNFWLKSIEAELLDESWEKMKHLLDEQMPHAVPPKPGRPKYELIVLVALFAWTVYLYWPSQEERSIWKEVPLAQPEMALENEATEVIQPIAQKASEATVAESPFYKAEFVSTSLRQT